MHWAIAVPFMVCYTTAVILVTIYNPDPSRPYRLVFSWIHRLSGTSLFLAPLLTFLWHRRDLAIHFKNVGTVWRWRLDDFKWLLLMAPATLNKRIQLPDQEKFNAAEKINFMVLTATVPAYIVTGVLIWLPGVAFLSWLVHLSMAAMATPLILGHIFMATINPDTRIGLQGMISGWVDRHWAEHHYGHWYREHFGHLHRPAVTPVAEIVPAASAIPSPAADAKLAGITIPLPGPGNSLPQIPARDGDAALANPWPPFLRPTPSSRRTVEETT